MIRAFTMVVKPVAKKQGMIFDGRAKKAKFIIYLKPSNRKRASANNSPWSDVEIMCDILLPPFYIELDEPNRPNSASACGAEIQPHSQSGALPPGGGPAVC
jgi:hypothetical protein